MAYAMSEWICFSNGGYPYGRILSLKTEEKGWKISCDLNTYFCILTSNCFFKNGHRKIDSTATETCQKMRSSFCKTSREQTKLRHQK